MQPRIIALIYFYVVSAAALMLLIIGIFNSVNVAVNLLAYNQYPLPYSGQDCNAVGGMISPKGPVSATVMPIAVSTPSSEQVQQQKEECVASQLLARKQQEVSDIKGALTYTIVGLVLFLIHFPIARRMSSEKTPS